MLLLLDSGEVSTRKPFLIFNANASSYRGTQVSSLYRRFEREKQRKYEQRIREVEMGSFTPLVFSTFGGMSHASTVFYKRLAFLVSERGSL